MTTRVTFLPPPLGSSTQPADEQKTTRHVSPVAEAWREEEDEEEVEEEVEEETEETEDEETETPEKMLEYNEVDIVVFVEVVNRLTDGLLIMIGRH